MYALLNLSEFGIWGSKVQVSFSHNLLQVWIFLVQDHGFLLEKLPRILFELLYP